MTENIKPEITKNPSYKNTAGTVKLFPIDEVDAPVTDKSASEADDGS